MDFQAELHAEQLDLLMARGFSREQADLAVRSLTPGAVHIDSALSNLAVSIQNREMIADLVLPKLKVAKPSDKYFVWNTATMFETNETLAVGQEGMPGRTRYGLSTSNYSCVNYALMDFVGRVEEDIADAPLQPRMSATKIVVQRLALAKERRAAALVFGSGNYGANYAALSGTNRWDSPLSDPAQAIDDAIEACVVRPNVLVLGAQVWQKLKNHPNLKELIFNRAATTSGAVPLRVTTQLLADAFDLDAVIVGRAKYVSSREGQTATYGYAWGKFAALIHQAKNPDPRETQAFGYQFEYQPLETQVVDAPLPGLKGGTLIKVAQSVAEVVIGGEASGYLFGTAVS